MWGYNAYEGGLGLNDQTHRSSPTQVPGTTWSDVGIGYYYTVAPKTDGKPYPQGPNKPGAKYFLPFSKVG